MTIPSLKGLKATKDPRNVVLIVLDTQRVKNMSCYGYGKPTTPCTDKVAAEGVLFENNFVPGCWTVPSHTSMFTGLYPFTHRSDMEHAEFDDVYPTWAEIAYQLGYRTAAFNPNTWVRATQADRGFHLIDSCEKPPNIPSGTQFAVDQFRRWLDVYSEDKRPFFTFLNFGDPHLVCRPEEPFRSRFLPDDVTIEEAEALQQNPHLRIAGIKEWTERDWRILKGLNDGATAMADNHVGQVYDALAERGLLDDTLFIVTSDHGDVYDEHPPLFAHVMNVYDACIHVPLVCRAPGLFEGGARCESLVQATDFVPTFLDMLGVEAHESLDCVQGKSLVPALSGETRDFIYAEDPFPWNEIERYFNYEERWDMRKFYRFLRTVRDHDYKYIYSSRGDDELYHVREDKDEQKNLIDEKPDVARAMLKKMEEWLWTMPLRDKPPILNCSPIKPPTRESARRMELWRGAPPLLG